MGIIRQLSAMVLVLATAVLGCCGLPSWPAPPESMRTAPPAPPATTSAQVVVVDVALIERPRGDSYLDQGLWDLGNEQGVDLETKPILEENGLRVGQIGGLLPARLQALLTSPRSCPNPRRIRAELDQPAPIPVSASRSRIAFEVHHGETSRRVVLADASCFFEVTPTLEGERRVRLRFVPRIRHGQARVQPGVTRDPDGTLRWTAEAREPVEDFVPLSWELTVNPEEYVLVGGRIDRPNTLGSAYFLGEGKGTLQKLLVLRASLLIDSGIDETLVQVPPLALQASMSAQGNR